jgi:pimeloyl-ACP methyl ester carboxylesterase
MDIQALQLSVPQERIDDLHARLRNARFPADINNRDWKYGASREYLEEFVASWLEYDWRVTEKEINSYDNFVTEIDGLRTHFLHKRGEGERTIPLLLCHGWPWTFWDYRAAVDLLTSADAFGDGSGVSFDVVVPSLPGFGLSTPMDVEGVGTFETADIWPKLMKGLGYERFGVAGGDFGVTIAAMVGHKYPDQVIGVHTTIPPILGSAREGQPGEDALAMVLRRLGGPTEAMPREAFESDSAWRWDLMRERWIHTISHVATQVAAPQTISYGMHDSPVALAAWILERRFNYSDNNGHIEDAYSRRFLLDLVSLWWFTDCFVSTARYYYHSFRRPWQRTHPGRSIEVPVGVPLFPKELAFAPREVAEQNLNLVRWTEYDRGGHFAPSEVPDLWAKDVHEFFRDVTL